MWTFRDIYILDLYDLRDLDRVFWVWSVRSSSYTFAWVASVWSTSYTHVCPGWDLYDLHDLLHMFRPVGSVWSAGCAICPWVNIIYTSTGKHTYRNTATQCWRSSLESMTIDSLKRLAEKKRSRIFWPIFDTRDDLDYRDLDSRFSRNPPVFGIFSYTLHDMYE